MARFKVGDRVMAKFDCDRYYFAGATGTVVEVDETSYYIEFDKAPGVKEKSDGTCSWYAGLNSVTAALNKADHVIATSRSNDPATSKGKRRINKYEQAVLDALDESEFGMTGKEIAERTGHPLNCITPRFAPLRRKNKIEPMEMRGKFVKRDKQIVWVLA